MADDQPTVERWLPIPGYEGHYEVSDHGRVRSLDRVTPGKDGANRPFRGRLLKPRPQRFGHLKVVLYSGKGQKRQRYVHQLVLEAFVGKRPDGAITCHNNGDPSDNRVENLRWGTHSENTTDRISHGTDPNLRKTHCPQGHEYVQENIVYGSHGERTCRTCRNARSRIAMRRKRALVK